jgi:hypothetical protein
MNQLITELKINLDNGYKWFRLTPPQFREFFSEETGIQEIFSFNVNNFEYFVAYENNGELHFWNHTIPLQNLDVDDIAQKDLNIFKGNELLKIVATLFSIMQFLSKKHHIFILNAPENIAGRSELYYRLIESNYHNFLNGFKSEKTKRGVVLSRQTPYKESTGIRYDRTTSNSRFDDFVNQILEKYNK